MKKSEIKEFPKYYEYYINLNEDIDLAKAFDKSLNQIDTIDTTLLKHLGLKVYADGKWSVNKIIQHVTDWERIWCYRTLLCVRKEGTVPHGNDDQVMAENSNADVLSIEQVLQELRAVRLATKEMFLTYTPQMLMTNCKLYNCEMSVLAMGFNIIGHQLHHFNIIKERYIPLLSGYR